MKFKSYLKFDDNFTKICPKFKDKLIFKKRVGFDDFILKLNLITYLKYFCSKFQQNWTIYKMVIEILNLFKTLNFVSKKSITMLFPGKNQDRISKILIGSQIFKIFNFFQF